MLLLLVMRKRQTAETVCLPVNLCVFGVSWSVSLVHLLCFSTLPFCLSIHLSCCVSVCVNIFFSVTVSLWVFLSVCVSMYPSVSVGNELLAGIFSDFCTRKFTWLKLSYKGITQSLLLCLFASKFASTWLYVICKWRILIVTFHSFFSTVPLRDGFHSGVKFFLFPGWTWEPPADQHISWPGSLWRPSQWRMGR